MNSQSAESVFLAAIKQKAPSVISLMDRESYSPTYGCMDRTYWAWKFTDFHGARFQEGICSLSFLYSENFDNNPYYQNPSLYKWICGGIDFWLKIQHKDGSFDEAYPFERSLAATAFTTFYLCEAWNFLQENLPADLKVRFLNAINKVGIWLIKNDEKHGFLSNHLAAAAGALYHIFLITGDSGFKERSRHFINRILEHQSTEGWYDEYDGADPGYQTHGSFYLARYYQLSEDESIAQSLDKAFSFLAHFIHTDGSIGGEYTSRNTQTYYPAAFEMMSHKSGTAHWIANSMLESVKEKSAAVLETVDIYNLFPMLNNYIFAYLASKTELHKTAVETPPKQEGKFLHFPKAGMLKVQTPIYEVYVGLEKGGVVKAFNRDKKSLVLNNCGYIGKLKNGKLISSQTIDKMRKVEISNDGVVIDGSFVEVKKPVMTPVSFIGFRIFSITIGQIRSVSYWLKSLLVKVLIYKKNKLDLAFKRHIIFGPDYLEINDTLTGSLGNKIQTLAKEDLFTTIHMGSSRYFVPNDLKYISKDNILVDHTKLKNGIKVSNRIQF